MTDVRALAANATEALKRGDRDGIVAVLESGLRDSGGSAEALSTVLQLADHISEIDLAIAAARQLAAFGTLAALTRYWGLLISYGRAAEAQRDMRRQPENIAKHPSVLYLLGKVAAERGLFAEAESLFREALEKAPRLAIAWIGLAGIKRFKAGDPDIAAMEGILPQLPEDARATVNYALGKASEDCGDVDRAFSFYSAGAAIRQAHRRFDVERFERAANEAIAGYTAENLGRLSPPDFTSDRALFVTGLPRSGTTLVQQVLQGHSAVAGGAEVNLFGAAILPTRGIAFANALAFQQASRTPDPWGSIGRSYHRLLAMRFPGSQKIVDKSLGQSLLTGLMLHTLRDARIAWLRRSPEDVAISCFSTQFDGGLDWTWSLPNIADYMRIEDRLFAHWRATFPDRILEIPYERFVASPGKWVERLQQHFGLQVEQGIDDPVRRSSSTVDTASMSQVREPISSRFIGRAARFERHLGPFRDRYYR